MSRHTSGAVFGVILALVAGACGTSPTADVRSEGTDTTVELAETVAPSTIWTTTPPDPVTVVPPCSTPVESPTSADPDDPCFSTEAGVLETPTMDIVATALAGRWRRCERTPGIFGADRSEAGLEFAAEGTWWKLDADYVAIEGWGNQGTWELIDTTLMNGPGHFQLNMMTDGAGTVITSPVFTPDAAKVRLNNNGMYLGDYVRLG